MDLQLVEEIIHRFLKLSCKKGVYVNDMKGGEYTEGYRDGYDDGWYSCYDDCGEIINELSELIKNERE